MKVIIQNIMIVQIIIHLLIVIIMDLMDIILMKKKKFINLVIPYVKNAMVLVMKMIINVLNVISIIY